jgi:hypothetical protein
VKKRAVFFFFFFLPVLAEGLGIDTKLHSNCRSGLGSMAHPNTVVVVDGRPQSGSIEGGGAPKSRIRDTAYGKLEGEPNWLQLAQFEEEPFTQ